MHRACIVCCISLLTDRKYQLYPAELVLRSYCDSDDRFLPLYPQPAMVALAAGGAGAAVHVMLVLTTSVYVHDGLSVTDSSLAVVADLEHTYCTITLRSAEPHS